MTDTGGRNGDDQSIWERPESGDASPPPPPPPGGAEPPPPPPPGAEPPPPFEQEGDETQLMFPDDAAGGAGGGPPPPPPGEYEYEPEFEPAPGPWWQQPGAIVAVAAGVAAVVLGIIALVVFTGDDDGGEGTDSSGPVITGTSTSVPRVTTTTSTTTSVPTQPSLTTGPLPTNVTTVPQAPTDPPTTATNPPTTAATTAPTTAATTAPTTAATTAPTTAATTAPTTAATTTPTTEPPPPTPPPTEPPPETTAPSETTAPETTEPATTAPTDSAFVILQQTNPSFAAVVAEAELQDALESGEFTVLAPPNEVVDGIDPTLLDEAAEKVAFVNAHLVSGSVDLAALQAGPVQTRGGQTLTTSGTAVTSDAGPTANIVTPDQQATNGIVHGIDNVLLVPVAPEQTAPTTPPSQPAA